MDSFPGHRSLATGTRLGARLVNRADRIYVGQITSLACPYASPGGILAGCFQIEFADGRREWMPWLEAAHRCLAAVPSVDR